METMETMKTHCVFFPEYSEYQACHFFGSDIHGREEGLGSG